MADLQALLSDIRAVLEKVEGRIRRHPYILAIDEGKIEKARLQIFAGEQYHIISSDIRSVASLLSRWGHGTGLDFFWTLLQGEVQAYKALLGFASALGVSEEALRGYEPLAGSQAYKAYLAWLSICGSDAEVAAAFLVNLPAWGANCGRMSQALKTNYGFKREEVAFFDLFSTPIVDFEQKATIVIGEGLSRGVAPLAIKTAARLLQDYELLFWDTLWEASR
jgi:pyrroloquinoline quinone (PQQ) biosynthesis protein C